MSVTSLLRATACAVVLLIFVLDTRAAGQGCSTFSSCSSCVQPRVNGGNCTWCVYAGRCMVGFECLQYSTQTHTTHVEATTVATCPTIYDLQPNRLPKGKPNKISFMTNFPFIGQMDCRFSDLAHRTDVIGPTTSVARPVNNSQTLFTCSTPTISPSTTGDVSTRVEFISRDHLSDMAISGNRHVVFSTCLHSGCVTTTRRPQPTPPRQPPSSTHGPQSGFVQPSTPVHHLPTLTNPSRSRCIITGGLDLIFNATSIQTTHNVIALFEHPGASDPVDCHFFNAGSRLRCPIPRVHLAGTVSTVTVHTLVAVFRNVATITYDNVPHFNVQRHNRTFESDSALLLQGVRIQSGGLTSNDYTVKVGSSICREVSLTANSLSCQPEGLSVSRPGEEYAITVTAGHFRVSVGSVSVREAEVQAGTEEPQAQESSTSTLAVSMGIVGVLLVIVPGIAFILVRRNGSYTPGALAFQRRFKRRDSLRPLSLDVPASVSVVSTADSQDISQAQSGASEKKDGLYTNQASNQTYDDTELAGVVDLKQDIPQPADEESPNLYATCSTAHADTKPDKPAAVVQTDQEIYS